MRLLRKLSNEHGTAVLVVTHDTRMIGEVDRVLRLMDGQVAAEQDLPSAQERRLT